MTRADIRKWGRACAQERQDFAIRLLTQTPEENERDHQAEPMAESEATYFVGNILRGFFSFTATGDEEAWITGQRIFAAHYPSETGRAITLLKIIREGTTEAGTPEGVVLHHRALL